MNTPSREPLISRDSIGISDATKAKIAGLLLAASIGTGIFAYGHIEGFNSEPRASHSKGIELTNSEANKKVMCLRELFHDLIRKPLFKNRWMANNCDQAKMAKLSEPPNQLRNIVEERKDVFREEGISPATETWLRDRGNMKIKIDTTSKEIGINAGKIQE